MGCIFLVGMCNYNLEMSNDVVFREFVHAKLPTPLFIRLVSKRWRTTGTEADKKALLNHHWPKEPLPPTNTWRMFKLPKCFHYKYDVYVYDYLDWACFPFYNWSFILTLVAFLGVADYAVDGGYGIVRRGWAIVATKKLANLWNKSGTG
eukprot:TRINITY_DN67918_c9_g4_i1.p1 TRINITY_DN67918_c9_g4~~TRINITY_DN67918_c9_g4_i1.p1  ORF type:complete len:149 (-),score=11.29 TRINITY_DN67918_c9_g4_i1:142-588(-)